MRKDDGRQSAFMEVHARAHYIAVYEKQEFRVYVIC